VPIARICSALATAAVAFLATGCGLRSPEAPTWNVQLAIPLAADTVRVRDIVERTDMLRGSGDTVSFHSSASVPETQVGDALVVTSFAGTQMSAELGTFTIAAPAPIHDVVSLQEISPVPISGGTGGVAIPAFTFPAQERTVTIGTSGGFESAAVTRATLSLTVTNHLGLSIDALHLIASDPASGDVIFAWDFPGTLAQGGTTNVSLALPAPGSTLYLGSSVTMEIDGHSAGGVTVQDTGNLDVDVAFAGNIEVTTATAQVPAQQIARRLATSLDASHRISSAAFRSGTLAVSVENRSPVGGTVNLQFRELTDPTHGGAPLTSTVSLPPNGTEMQYIPLAGLTYSSQTPNALTVDAMVSTETTPGSVTMSSGDGFTLNTSGSGIVFESVTGVLDTTRVALSSSSVDIDVPDGLTGTSFDRARCTLTLHTNANVPGHVELWITGRAHDGRTVTLTQGNNGLPPVVLPLVAGEGGTLIVDETNSNIVDFMSNLPERIEVSGSAVVGDGVTNGSIARTDVVSGTFDIQLPLSLSLAQPVTVTTAVDSLRIDDDTRKQIDKHLRGLEIVADLENGLPFGAAVTLVVSRTRAGASDTVAVQGQTTVLHAIVAAASGETHVPGRSHVQLALDEADIPILTAPQLYMKSFATLAATAGSVSAFSDDTFVIRSRLQAVTRVSQ
jgi:hypothetical protein